VITCASIFGFSKETEYRLNPTVGQLVSTATTGVLVEPHKALMRDVLPELGGPKKHIEMLRLVAWPCRLECLKYLVKK
jgi:hypothetical protein